VQLGALSRSIIGWRPFGERYGFGFDTIILSEGVILAPGNWDDTVIWSTNKSVLDPGDRIVVNGVPTAGAQSRWTRQWCFGRRRKW
jgi:hypothetical protein